MQLGSTWESSNALYLSKEKSISQFCAVGYFWRNYFFSSAKGKGEWSFGGAGEKENWIETALVVSTGASEDTFPVTPAWALRAQLEHEFDANFHGFSVYFTILPCETHFRKRELSRINFYPGVRLPPLPNVCRCLLRLNLHDTGCHSGEVWNWILFIWLKSKDQLNFHDPSSRSRKIWRLNSIHLAKDQLNLYGPGSHCGEVWSMKLNHVHDELQ